MDGLGHAGAGHQGLQPGLVEGMDGIKDGIGIAVQLGRNPRGPLAIGAGEQNLAAAQHESVTRAQPLHQGGSLIVCQRSNEDRCSCHAWHHNTPIALSVTALRPLGLAAYGLDPCGKHLRGDRRPPRHAGHILLSFENCTSLLEPKPWLWAGLHCPKPNLARRDERPWLVHPRTHELSRRRLHTWFQRS